MSGILHGALELGRRIVEVPDWRRDSAAKISVDTELDARPGREIGDEAANDEEGDLRDDARDVVDVVDPRDPGDRKAASDESTDDVLMIPMLAAAS